MTIRPAPVAFPPIERHGVVGDRRTGALVAADGTVDWWCAPNFDGAPIFGALLDPDCGGFCRWGPPAAPLGRQSYLPDTALLETSWTDPEDIRLVDVMVWPGEKREARIHDQRVMIRRLKVATQASVRFDLRPRRNFSEAPKAHLSEQGGTIFPFSDGALGIWASFPLDVRADAAFADLTLQAGDEHWVALGWKLNPGEWSIGQARKIFEEAESYWRNWSAELKIQHGGSRDAALRRSAMTVQLLSHAEHDSAVAALTTSLPERIGADRNYDYRYAWIRDASLSLALLARLGKAKEVERYLHWLCGLKSEMPAPLQVCYRLDGNPKMEQTSISDVLGYENSRPVRRGNHAAKQKQLGAMGFFADCSRTYIDHGGEWREEFWQLLKRAADFTCKNWQEKDCGVWELSEEAHYVASRVMAWVVLERAVSIAEKTGHAGETDHWRQTATAVHAEVMHKGWCEEKNAFRQRYDSDALDASALLIPLMNFLPVDHPRVTGTLAAVERELMVDGLLHRFDPAATLGGKQPSMGDFEGAFLPCVFWHAQVLAKTGRCDEAEAILSRCEAISGDTGLFAEEVDARHNRFLGNTPLLFSHVEYVRAVIELNQARSRAASKNKGTS